MLLLVQKMTIINSVIKKSVLATVLTTVMLLSSLAPVYAKDYIVEVIIFENTSESSVTEPHAYQAPRKPKTNGSTWALDNQLLTEQADKISNSGGYILRHHFAWGQESLPYSKSTTYTVVENDTQGFIKVYADQLLFANIDIDFKGFRMVEKRRLKLNEKHFFDHPKFGLLLQVSRLEEDPDFNNS